MPALITASTVRLPRIEWLERAAAHRARVEPWITPRLERRRRGQRHPVDDFLFDYYSFRPAQLARWQPGAGIAIQGPADALPGYVDRDGWLQVDPAAVQRVAAGLPGVERLLRATAARRPRIGCSALHEWAMVYQVPHEQVRHAAWPLRLSGEAIADVVERIGLRCTHFDAYRFFAADAVPRNERVLSRTTQVDHEQPGCLHATMDLYKWSYRLSPLVGSDLIADAFDLARQARTLDMRAAPYDLRELGVVPLLLETAGGRAEFAACQTALAQQGALLRQRLIDTLQHASGWLADQRSS